MIYLIQKVGFDSWENRLENARHVSNIGYAFSKEKATQFLEKNKLKTSKQWDNEYYPYYKVTEIEELDI